MTDPHSSVNTMPIMEHLIELKNRLTVAMAALFIAFLGCYYFAADIYNFLVAPLAQILTELGGNRRMIYTALHEAFFTQLKVSFFAAFLLAFPVIATQFWRFLAPGLYKNEKAALAPYLVLSPILFIMGGALVYYFIMPMAWKFFLSFETMGGGDGTLPIQLEAKVNEYLSLVMKLIFAFGISFQLPLVLTLLARIGFATSRGLAAKRKYAVVVTFIFAAFMTPPDIISQVGLAIPILVLYEISIISVRAVEKKQDDTIDEEDEDEFEETDFNMT
ncbi:twin-arginine translocase subunit TatC [Terasakiella sp. SH-1]|uniref:twin-arginine translocase subunit TatC n=1 Tax=Terasakiella sp. SH-1 TaxID=2560057 RepID=UPI001F0E4902|nr:twin-arginine translocase subunit TatC [Terasakiella sp. SH-1]